MARCRPLLLLACLLMLSACRGEDAIPTSPAGAPATDAVAVEAATDLQAEPGEDAPALAGDDATVEAPPPRAPYVPWSGEWPVPDKVERDGKEADLLVQFGDIDNFGFGFPNDYDPFSGRPSRIHPYPRGPSEDDAPGTDRIFVISGYVDPEPADGRWVRRDGYTSRSTRPDNQPFPLRLAFDLDGLEIRAAALQLFVDDFQPARFGSRYHVRINGQDLPEIAASMNQLDQTGPIGKLLTVQLLPERLHLLDSGRIEIDIDDAHSNIGDGFAFDFVRLLVNPKPWASAGTVRGRVTDRERGEALPGVLVSASNTRQATTDADGRYLLEGVPAGMLVTSASHPDYLPAATTKDLAAGAELELDFTLDPNPRTSTSLGDQLDDAGKVDLYGIHFDTDQATLKPDSEAVLEQVHAALAARPALAIVIAGHTDAEGDDAHNLALSERRAAAVRSSLEGKGIASARMRSEGHGESAPVAGNDTPEGRALNRRVEIRDANR